MAPALVVSSASAQLPQPTRMLVERRKRRSKCILVYTTNLCLSCTITRALLLLHIHLLPCITHEAIRVSLLIYGAVMKELCATLVHMYARAWLSRSGRAFHFNPNRRRLEDERSTGILCIALERNFLVSLVAHGQECSLASQLLLMFAAPQQPRNILMFQPTILIPPSSHNDSSTAFLRFILI